MTTTALGYPLNTLRDGVVGFVDKEPYAQPSVTTDVKISVERGFATIITSRTFCHDEKSSIEAILTFPAPFEAVLTSLKVSIDGRDLTAIAQGKVTARETYEDALDRGKTAILHEEAMRGVHVLSICQLASGVEVTVLTQMVMPLANLDGTPTLRSPFTIGQIYGASPLLPSDDLITGRTKNDCATITLHVDAGRAVVDGKAVDAQTFSHSLAKGLFVLFPETSFGLIEGHDAQGRGVSISMAPLPSTIDKLLNISILFDRSGSTAQDAGCSKSIWQAMHEGLATAFKSLRQGDRIELWDFDEECRHLGFATGSDAHSLIKLIGEARGGTELGGALEKVVSQSKGDILVLTDGNSWHTEVHKASQLGRRITSVLVGENSFEAMIGRLASLTGGQIFAAAGNDVAVAINSALNSLRDQSSAIEGDLLEDRPQSLRTTRSGVKIDVHWSDVTQKPCDAIGRYAAALALPLMSESSAESFAISHDLCTHLTSLIIVDEEGTTSPDIPLVRKVSLIDNLMASNCSRSVHMKIIPEMSAQYYSLRDLSTNWSASEEFIEENDVKSSGRIIDLVQRIDWDCHTNKLLAGKLSVLDEDDIALIRQMSQDDAIEELGRDLSEDPVTVVLALLARLAEGKTAERLARRILTSVTEDRIQAILIILATYVRDQRLRTFMLHGDWD